MKYREFKYWFLDKLIHGRLDVEDFTCCDEVINLVEREPLSGQETMWQRLNEEKQIVTNVVETHAKKMERRLMKVIEKRLQKEGKIK